MSNEKKEEKHVPVVDSNSGLATRTAAYRAVYHNTGDHRAAVRAYCQGDKWLTENAKAVGNWE